MSKIETNKFKRGITNKQAVVNAKAFFSSPLGKKILEAKRDGSNPFQICIRDNYFNIYWKGCSVLKFCPMARKNTYIIHDKYVLGAEGQSAYLSLEPRREMIVNDLIGDNGWSFDKNIIDPAIIDGKIPFLEKYIIRKDGKSLNEKALLKAYLEIKEKPFLLDLEVAFSRLNKNDIPVADRVDIAEITYEGNTPILKLVEVKASGDSRLRARGVDDSKLYKEKKIMDQMNTYREFLENEMKDIQQSYRNVAENMLSFGFDKFLPGLKNLPATKVLEDFASRGVVDPNPSLLILTNSKGKDEVDPHFKTLKRVINQAYPSLRHIQISET